MSRGALILVGVVIALVGGRFLYGALTRPDDRTQVKQALADAIEASREGRPGSVVDKLSDTLKVNGEGGPSLRQVAEFVKNNHPRVTVANTEPTIRGDEAEIDSDVRIEISLLGERSLDLKGVQILFRKESSRDWLIFPTTKWKLSEVRIAPGQLPDFSAFGMGGGG